MHAVHIQGAPHGWVGVQGAHCGYAARVQLTKVICNNAEITARHNAETMVRQCMYSAGNPSALSFNKSNMILQLY